MFPGRVLRLRFEDLLADTSAVLDRVSRFLKVSSSFEPNRIDEDMHRFAQQLSHHQLLSQPLDPARVGQWKRELSPDAARSIEKICHGMMVPLGYEQTAIPPC